MDEAVPDKKSYRQILKSTSIMGGSSLVIIGFRIIRTKIFAVLLGPAGVGLLGIFDSITSVAITATGLGIGNSGVRQIAEAAGTGDQRKISRTVICLRRTVLFSGLAGLCLLVLLSGPISRLTFGNSDHARDLSLLSITILFTALSGGQTAVIQGTRRIKDLAMLSILGALFGTVLSIPIVYFFGARGIAPYLISVSAMNIIASWWYSRKIKIMSIAMSWRETLGEAKPLLKLGLIFMVSSLMTAGTFYLLRVFIVRSLGLEGAGIYQAATALSLLYTAFILDAMGRDFYPRLTAVVQDNRECNALMNKQMEVGLLLAAPGIIATMTFAPVVISLFYSPKFMLAVSVLRWQILGILLRVITWPMSYIFPAKGNGRLFFWTEVFANTTHLCLVWLGLKYFGLSGAGMAFFGMYVFYCLLIYRIVRTSYQFVMSRKNMQIIAVSTGATLTVFLSPFLLPATVALIVNAGVTIALALYSIKAIVTISGPETMPAVLLRIKSYFNPQ